MVDQLYVLLLAGVVSGVSGAPGATGLMPGCSKDGDNGVGTMICRDSDLATLDRQLDEVYRAALARTRDVARIELKAEQKGWVKGRDACWTAENPHLCIRAAYRYRIAEMQARFGLVPDLGDITLMCEDRGRRTEVAITYYSTKPKTLLARNGAVTALMFQDAEAAGSVYRGPNVALNQTGAKAYLRWGDGAPMMPCRPVR